MNDPFYNFPIYRVGAVPENSAAVDSHGVFRTSFVVLHDADEIPEAVQKIRQIMSSVKLKPEMYSIEGLNDGLSVFDNALKSKKVTHLMIFNHNIQKGSDHPLNEPFDEQDTSVFITSRIEDILEEERTGETALRRALWSGMKKWLGSQ